MIYKTTSDKSLQEVKENLTAHAKEHTFGVLHQYEFQKILQAKGFPIDKDITVYELCNPKGAQEVLTQLSEISVFLPCRISVYEENGKTVLATINLETLVDTLNLNDEIKQHLHAIYKDFIALLNSF